MAYKKRKRIYHSDDEDEEELNISECDDSSSSDESDDDQVGSGLASVMSQILGKKVESQDSAVMAKAVPDKVILEKKKAKLEPTAEKEQKILESMREKQIRRKAYIESGRVKPTMMDRNRERNLQKVATKGVVQLFNAVKQQQKSIGKKLSETKTGREEDELMKESNKESFFELLKKKSEKKSKKSKTIKTEDSDEDKSNIKIKEESYDEDDDVKPSWEALEAEFTGGVVRNWDKQSDLETSDYGTADIPIKLSDDDEAYSSAV